MKTFTSCFGRSFRGGWETGAEGMDSGGDDDGIDGCEASGGVQSVIVGGGCKDANMTGKLATMDNQISESSQV